MPKLLFARDARDAAEERRLRKLAGARHAPGDLPPDRHRRAVLRRARPHRPCHPDRHRPSSTPRPSPGYGDVRHLRDATAAGSSTTRFKERSTRLRLSQPQHDATLTGSA